MTGTTNQIELAEQIRRDVEADFDRVAAAFVAVAARQKPDARADTTEILAILERTRSRVLANQGAGYFIRDWGQRGSQIRDMLLRDPEYVAVRARRQGRG